MRTSRSSIPVTILSLSLLLFPFGLPRLANAAASATSCRHHLSGTEESRPESPADWPKDFELILDDKRMKRRSEKRWVHQVRAAVKDVQRSSADLARLRGSMANDPLLTLWEGTRQKALELSRWMDKSTPEEPKVRALSEIEKILFSLATVHYVTYLRSPKYRKSEGARLSAILKAAAAIDTTDEDTLLWTSFQLRRTIKRFYSVDEFTHCGASH